MKLQKIKLREMRKSTKNKIWNGSILAAFIAAAAVFILMLQAEKKVLAEYEKITVCVTIDDLPKGESITEDNILNYVQTVEIDRKIVPDTAIKNMDEITGRIAVHRIEKGSVVTRGMLESEEQITGEMEEAVIAGFRAEDLYQAVGGVLRAGDRIHIYCIDKAKPVYEVLPGWACDISGIKEYDKLPENCRKYIEFIEKELGVPITMVSNGPKRTDIIYRNK